MKKASLIGFVLICFIHLGLQTPIQPNLQSAEDLKALGVGRVIESDGTIIKNIKLLEIKEYWIVYIKNNSTHDLMMEKINRIEFDKSNWGQLKIIFENNQAKISPL